MPRFTYAVSRLICQAIFSTVARRHVFHGDRSRAFGRWLLAGNHISHFDPLILTSVVSRQIDWMAMSDLFKPRWLGWWLRHSDCFPVQRFKADRVALKTAIERLQRDHVVGMFPEGGLRDGPASVLGGAPLRRGIRAVAELGGAAVIPCVILGSDRLYRAANWRPFRRVPVWIGFGQPIQSSEHPELEQDLAQALRDLAAEMREHFNLTDDDFPKSPQDRMRGL